MGPLMWTVFRCFSMTTMSGLRLVTHKVRRVFTPQVPPSQASRFCVNIGGDVTEEVVKLPHVPPRVEHDAASSDS